MSRLLGKKDDTVRVTLDSFELRLIVRALMELRNGITEKGKDPQDVEDLILRIADTAEKVSRKDRG
ncbi:MAG: hypothetical protein J5744_07640 [Oscillospiraceae bacterium]|nr:hypothetical protein [Oscillospiraceae bacterium]